MDHRVEELQQALTLLQRMKEISGTPTGRNPYAPGGMFGVCGLENQVLSLHLQPQGLDRVLPVFPTTFVNPLFPAITGYEGDGTAEPVGKCADCPGGTAQTCILTVPPGRICRETEEMDANELILQVNRGVFTDLALFNPAPGAPSPFRPSTPGDILRSAITAQMVTVGVLLQRALSRMVWQGNPAHNTAQGGYAEFPGLDLQVTTGHVDAITGVACQALDSDIKDFQYGDVGGAEPDIVAYLAAMELYLRHIAERSGLMPVEWIIAMRPELFIELTAVWPCRYLTYRCDTVANERVAVINDNVNVAMRDEMRNGNFLWVNGRRIPVVTDDGIYEENSANNPNLQPGQFASDIYLLPLRARGRPVLYYEYVDYSKLAAEVGPLGGKQAFWWTDDGRFLWNLQQMSWCFKLQAITQPRLALRTPQLAGRIQNVKYAPLQHLRSPYDDDPYFVKGGVAQRTPPTYHTPWSQP